MKNIKFTKNGIGDYVSVDGRWKIYKTENNFSPKLPWIIREKSQDGTFRVIAQMETLRDCKLKIREYILFENHSIGNKAKHIIQRNHNIITEKLGNINFELNNQEKGLVANLENSDYTSESYKKAFSYFLIRFDLEVK